MIRNFMINLKERPEILFPLFGDLKRFSKIGPKVEKNFKNAGFNHPIDLLFLLPSTYIHRIKAKSILNFKDNYISIKVKVLSHDYNHYKKIKKILVTDDQTTFDLVFFNLKESYLKKVLPIEKEVLISGKVDYFKGKYQIIHPDYILDINQNEVIDEFDPVYPLFKGISQKLIKNVKSG